MAVPRSNDVSLVRPGNRMLALGMAANHLMSKPVFMKFPFGECCRMLAGSISRDHYVLAIDSSRNVQGLAGWGFASQENAEGWLNGTVRLDHLDCVAGKCILMNAWSANSTDVHRLLSAELRKLLGQAEALYYRRYYADGTSRSVRIYHRDLAGLRSTG